MLSPPVNAGSAGMREIKVSAHSAQQRLKDGTNLLCEDEDKDGLICLTARHDC
jgi:hypothetical protein